MLHDLGVNIMNIERFTQNAQTAIMDCQNIAISEGHQMLDGEHLHLALLMQKDGLIPKLLKYMEVDPTSLIADLDVYKRQSWHCRYRSFLDGYR